MTIQPPRDATIDAAIDAAKARVGDLERQLRQQKKALKKLLEARSLSQGYIEDEQAKPPPLPDQVEVLLRERGAMHVSDIAAALKTQKQTVSSLLVRYAAREKRFKRVGANTFALTED
jgi:outer membrane protein TolC